ncbi:MAG: hypothetical protein OEX77_07125 [Candidatus Bathyarchaeota archaeon]|nr:hypothetical protein [Candidatus Bathyarchaeota archaeon]MDH5733547.1 hypothetical protein [Candidatus Bathyarchaeota archaeon]
MTSGYEKHPGKLIVGEQEENENMKPLVNDPKHTCKNCGRGVNNSDSTSAPDNL